MKVKDIKDIEIRLEELDRMESQILFSVSILSADDHVRLARIISWSTGSHGQLAVSAKHVYQ